MSRVIVVGGGLIGLATSLLITKQGHDVTVLERDPEPPPKTPEEATADFRAGLVNLPRDRHVGVADPETEIGRAHV